MADALDTMARTVWGEARGESDAGRAAVAWVIKNRASQPGWWGRDIETVCLKKWQFSCWNPTDPNSVKCAMVSEKIDKGFERIKEICRSVLSCETEDPTNGATHYHTKSISPAWAMKIDPCAEIGNHKFYKGV